MRWLYFNPADVAEAGQHRNLIEKIDAWWAEFSSAKGRLDAMFRRREQWDVVSWMEQHLHAVDSRLAWEFGPPLSGNGHRLVISCETHGELRPMVRELISLAPKLPDWQFLEWRPPQSVERALANVSSQLGVRPPQDVAVAVGEYNRVDLAYRWDELPADEESAFDAAFLTTELILGEQAVDRRVGHIQVADGRIPVENGQRFLPLDRLKPTFDAVVASVNEQLPTLSYAARFDDLQWALLELNPTDAVEYADRDDIITAVTSNADLLGATFAEAPFASERYSRTGECFCYLKIDGIDVSQVKFQGRQELEEAVQSALQQSKSGAMIGSGTGLRYSYIELALTDTNLAISALGSCLQAGNIPGRSWILFHDEELQAEWIGIYDDTPPPPGVGAPRSAS